MIALHLHGHRLDPQLGALNQRAHRRHRKAKAQRILNDARQRPEAEIDHLYADGTGLARRLIGNFDQVVGNGQFVHAREYSTARI